MHYQNRTVKSRVNKRTNSPFHISATTMSLFFDLLANYIFLLPRAPPRFETPRLYALEGFCFGNGQRLGIRSRRRGILRRRGARIHTHSPFPHRSLDTCDVSYHVTPNRSVLPEVPRRNLSGGKILQNCSNWTDFMFRNESSGPPRSRCRKSQIINYCQHKDVCAHWPLYRICKTFTTGTTIILVFNNSIFIAIIMMRERRCDSLTFLRFVFPQLLQYNHK